MKPSTLRRLLPALLLATGLLAAAPSHAQEEADGPARVEGTINEPATRSATPARVNSLQVPEGFRVSVAARGLRNARIMAVDRSGTIFLTRREQGDVLALRDTDRDGDLDSRRTVARGLPYVHGIALDRGYAYLVTDRELYRGRVRAGRIGRLDVLTRALPDAGQHPNRMLGFGPDGSLYISIGSTCNVCDETNRLTATIVRARPDGTRRKVFATGLRNTIGFDWHPETDALWAMDMGADWRGDEQPPEELNQIDRGKHYGWPFCYGPRQPDRLFVTDPPGLTKASFCARTEAPVLTYAAHAAPIDFEFYEGRQFPAEYRGDAFVTMRGSWNRGTPVGYEVVRVRYEGARAVAIEDFLTGFLIEDGRAQFGRVAGLAEDRDGSLLVAEDTNGVIYRVSAR